MKITTNNAVEAQIICAKRDFVEEIFDILGKEDMLLSDLARAAHMSRTQIYLQLGGAPNTLRRIAKGVLRYVINNPHPYIVKTDSCAESQRDKFALVSAFLSQYHGEQNKNEVRGQALSEPIMCVDSSNRYGLCAVTLLKNYSGVIGQKADSPAGTITAVDHHSLVACSLVRQFGTSNAADIESPLGTVMPHGNGKTGLVAAFLDKYYGTGGGAELNDPMPTITGRDRMSLVTVTIDGEQYAISDIGMRMLQPRELFRAQGFPEGYKIDFEYNGKPLPKSAQVRMCGNSVCPPVATAIIGANCTARIKREVA